MPTVLGWPQLINKAINREIPQLEIPGHYLLYVSSVYCQSPISSHL